MTKSKLKNCSEFKITKSLLKSIGDMGAWSGIYQRFKDQKKHKDFLSFLQEFYYPPKKRRILKKVK